jgi:hypothetical protein
MEIETHAWVDIEDIGICDFSPNLTEGGEIGWAHWPVRYLVGTRYFPRQEKSIGNYFFEEAQFKEHRENAMLRRAGYVTAYLEDHRMQFDATLVTSAVQYANSYLMQDLQRQSFFSANILAKAAVHVWNVAKGRTATTCYRSQLEAWRHVASIPDLAVSRFWSRARLGDSDSYDRGT